MNKQIKEKKTLFFTGECQLTSIVGIKVFRQPPLAAPIVVTVSSKNHQWILKWMNECEWNTGCLSKLKVSSTRLPGRNLAEPS